MPEKPKGNGKIDAAIDRAKRAPAGPGIAVVKTKIIAQAHVAEPGQFLKVQPKESKEPSLLVWIAELGAYQPVFLPPGTRWIITQEQDGPPKPRLYVPS